MPAIQPQIKPFLVHSTVSTFFSILELSYILCLWWFSLLLADSCLVVIACLFAASSQLSLAITNITAYTINNDGCSPRQKKQAACHYTDLLIEMGNSFRHNMHMHTLYWSCYDAILAILWNLHVHHPDEDVIPEFRVPLVTNLYHSIRLSMKTLFIFIRIEQDKHTYTHNYVVISSSLSPCH